MRVALLDNVPQAAPLCLCHRMGEWLGRTAVLTPVPLPEVVSPPPGLDLCLALSYWLLVR